MNKVTFDRGEMEERIVDIYVSADTLRDGETSIKREETVDTAPNNGPGDQHSVHVQWWRRPSGVAAVCLGLLCVLLLAGIIGLSVYYGVIGHHNSTERNQLQTSNNNLTKERDQLQTSYNTLTKERDQLQTSYNTLTKERDQLQTSYNTLTKERDQLQTSYNTLTKERDQLTNCKQTCPEGWQKFESSWYFLSTETKTWKESREDCLKRGAHLVIINSDKEQEFLFKLKKRVWIGLTDSVSEGTWKWVDGTPLTTPRYWNDNQPDSGDPSGEEDCVEIHKDWIFPLKAWNDMPCYWKLNWICEKVV
ncbi:C-type lectin domain family 4 member E-like isoform X1 [Oncorhynchus kisutch]|uniref:C-type lectin domain family 4 member E-like isoform X1 n=1 Tax=Oncorhynchus kisutch TaxID=8019 RepID=UPI0012DF2D49|nr:C-type lectin domain family 4 member E-like isoform X1 [Oncorhynchus kisutch]